METNNKNIAEGIEAAETEKPFAERLAMEMIRDEHNKSKSKNWGIVGLTVALIVITIGLSILNYKNDVDWRKLFESYDFISQDGDGINSANYGEQGDLNNGAENKVQEEQDNR